VKVRPQERAMAVQLIENLAEPFDPSKYRDEYQDKLHEIIKAKAKGKKLAIVDSREPEQTKVVDLVSRLQESLAASAGGKRGGKLTHKSATRRPAKTAKSTRRKTA
jgi:DNA end-binding protein Ku